MTPPTRRLTHHTAVRLGRPVDLAVRARRLDGDAPEPTDRRPVFPALGLPIVALVRTAWTRLKHLLLGDEDARILAFMPDGRRILMARARLAGLHPTTVLAHLDHELPLTIDTATLATELRPVLVIGDERFEIDGVDYGVLARAAVAGELHEPGLAAQVEPWLEAATAARAAEPETVRTMIQGGG